MRNRYCLGIDTSAYTTSIGIIDEDMNILLDMRETLKVPKGRKGLRQQEAIFQHLTNFPILINRASKEVDFSKVDTISVSTKPRNNIKSYMPVFIFGKNQGYILSKTLDTKYKQFSHQEGHIGAGLISTPNLDENFISLHISGGTTEFLLVKDLSNNLNIKLAGGSLDISFGQLIDRIGVYLGYEFPCGQKLDTVARYGNRLDIDIPIHIKDKFWTNLSGLENYFINLIETHIYREEDIVFSLFYVIAKVIKNILVNMLNKFEIESVLLTGGVASNSHIRKILMESLSKCGARLYFPTVELCRDNAIGISYLGKVKDGY